MRSGNTMYIINDIYDIIVKQIVYSDVVHRVSYDQVIIQCTIIIYDNLIYNIYNNLIIIIIMQLVENSLHYT